MVTAARLDRAGPTVVVAGKEIPIAAVTEVRTLSGSAAPSAAGAPSAGGAELNLGGTSFVTLGSLNGSPTGQT